MSPRILLTRAVLCTALVFGCGEGPVEPPRTDLVLSTEWNEPTAPIPAVPPVARTISMRVRSSAGQAVRGVRVAFVLIQGNGTLSTTSARTDANGLASTIWTFGDRVGTQEVRGYVPTLLNGSNVTFEAEVVLGPIVEIVLETSATSIAVGGADTLVLETRDAAGNAVPPTNPVVVASVNPAVATVSPAGVVTGVAAGSTTITTSSGGLTDSLQVRVGSFAPTIERASRYGPSSGGLVFNSSQVGFVSGSDLAGVWVFDARTLQNSSTLVTNRAERDIALSVDETRLYTGEYYGQSYTILEKSIATGATLRAFILAHRPYRLIASVDGSRLFVATTAGILYSINLSSGVATPIVISAGASLTDLDVSADGSLLAVASSSGVVTLLSPVTLDTLRTASFAPVASGVAFSRNAPWLYLGRPEGTLLRVHMNTLAVEAESGITGIFEMQPTDDRRYVVGIRSAGSAEILDATSLTSLATEDVFFPVRVTRQPGTRAIWVFGGFNLLVRLTLN